MSKLQTVIDNLNNTIAGKEQMLQFLRTTTAPNKGAEMAVDATMQFLEINLKELRTIRDDLLDIQK